MLRDKIILYTNGKLLLEIFLSIDIIKLRKVNSNTKQNVIK